MKVIFLGTPEFAVAPLKALISSENHQVVGVVTQPDRPVGRKNTITPPPVKVVALERGIPVFQYEKIRKDRPCPASSVGTFGWVCPGGVVSESQRLYSGDRC